MWIISFWRLARASRIRDLTAASDIPRNSAISACFIPFDEEQHRRRASAVGQAVERFAGGGAVGVGLGWRCEFVHYLGCKREFV